MKRSVKIHKLAQTFGSVVACYTDALEKARTLVRYTGSGVWCVDCSNQIIHGCYVELHIVIIKGKATVVSTKCRSCLNVGNFKWQFDFPSCNRPNALCSILHMTENIG
jgi:hypothetical protein